ncbi:inositol monophosphatase family protein [Streptomyces sedi]|uniref:Glucose-1-phosphate thymidylyltransferase n=1 Tax=Streptomyces sedi TaxID=555059 RepID=A0A5C4UR29_9ACTN|nr:inositol monophosphatase family protein [Streptomyces sedi]TNM25856.1 glucose-1-phosphate thymidylyltransferase [Streptomyces sedi]
MSALADDVRLAHRLATRADETALSFLAHGVTTRTKKDGSPVSDADLAVEEELLGILAIERPGDAVLAEESGAHGSATGRRWILDPIDGTRSYLAGGRSWGTHIACEAGGELTVGVLTRPTEGARWWAARGHGAYRSDPAEPLATSRRLAVTDIARLSEARVAGLVDPGCVGAEVLAALSTWTDDEVSVVAALLEGRVDVVLDDGGKVWDQAPAALLVREAGGFFSDPLGGSRLDFGWGLYANPLLRADLSHALREVMAERGAALTAPPSLTQTKKEHT